MYKTASYFCSHRNLVKTADQHPYRTQQVVARCPYGWLTDYAEKSAGVVLCSHSEAIFKAFNHEPHT